MEVIDMARMKQDIKFQFYITEKMDDLISYYSELQGISRSDFVRMCISQTVMGYELSVRMLKEDMKEGEKKKWNVEDFVTACGREVK